MLRSITSINGVNETKCKRIGGSARACHLEKDESDGLVPDTAATGHPDELDAGSAATQRRIFE
ncbi:hypothetical protein E2562_001731 [Oryza meyeriana var. granulata]|uniref:Uncharacterized protein n=1 Tax=Oryza meyeriana var. granulata TaxID=110450 RepID=A0A6G1CD40_9ORYZ|nr:hypothetical protein E2562_001731 [Oryza meyeriana var. granulata]